MSSPSLGQDSINPGDKYVVFHSKEELWNNLIEDGGPVESLNYE